MLCTLVCPEGQAEGWRRQARLSVDLGGEGCTLWPLTRPGILLQDQELESLAAIEAELERVAHKLHELRRG